MSADNWYVCPFCKGKKHPEYGTEEQVRADYELWLSDDGLWKIRGVAHCGVCSRAWIANIEIKPMTETTESEAWEACINDKRTTKISPLGSVTR